MKIYVFVLARSSNFAGIKVPDDTSTVGGVMNLVHATLPIEFAGIGRTSFHLELARGDPPNGGHGKLCTSATLSDVGIVSGSHVVAKLDIPDILDVPDIDRLTFGAASHMRLLERSLSIIGDMFAEITKDKSVMRNTLKSTNKALQDAQVELERVRRAAAPAAADPAIPRDGRNENQGAGALPVQQAIDAADAGALPERGAVAVRLGAGAVPERGAVAVGLGAGAVPVREVAAVGLGAGAVPVREVAAVGLGAGAVPVREGAAVGLGAGAVPVREVAAVRQGAGAVPVREVAAVRQGAGAVPVQEAHELTYGDLAAVVLCTFAELEEGLAPREVWMERALLCLRTMHAFEGTMRGRSFEILCAGAMCCRSQDQPDLRLRELLPHLRCSRLRDVRVPALRVVALPKISPAAGAHLDDADKAMILRERNHWVGPAVVHTNELPWILTRWVKEGTLGMPASAQSASHDFYLRLEGAVIGFAVMAVGENNGTAWAELRDELRYAPEFDDANVRFTLVLWSLALAPQLRAVVGDNRALSFRGDGGWVLQRGSLVHQEGGHPRFALAHGHELIVVNPAHGLDELLGTGIFETVKDIMRTGGLGILSPFMAAEQ
jgi:hypothetical protein